MQVPVVIALLYMRVLYVLADINNVQLLGRVGRDPEQRGDARPIVTFPLATTLTIRHSSEGGIYTL